MGHNIYISKITYFSASLVEYCEWDTFNPQCAGNEVVLVEKAVYGRMRTGSCIKDTRDISCYEDVTSMAHRKCSGRQSCEITIPDRDFDKTQPCGEMKNYLQISNTCIKGIYLFSTVRPKMRLINPLYIFLNLRITNISCYNFRIMFIRAEIETIPFYSS